MPTTLQDLFHLTDEQMREVERRTQRTLRTERMLAWMRRIPIVGRVVFVFWFNLIDEGVKQTLTPRWGSMTFSFFGDGDTPNLWFVWQEIRHTDYAGVWEPHRAPTSAAQADALRNGTHPFNCTEHPRKDGLLTRIKKGLA